MKLPFPQYLRSKGKSEPEIQRLINAFIRVDTLMKNNCMINKSMQEVATAEEAENLLPQLFHDPQFLLENKRENGYAALAMRHYVNMMHAIENKRYTVQYNASMPKPSESETPRFQNNLPLSDTRTSHTIPPIQQNTPPVEAKSATKAMPVPQKTVPLTETIQEAIYNQKHLKLQWLINDTIYLLLVRIYQLTKVTLPLDHPYIQYWRIRFFLFVT